MKFETLKFSDVTINYDKKRIPLSAMERIKRQGKYRYYGAQGIIDYIDDYIFDGKYLLIAEDGENLKSKKQNIAQIAEGKFWVNNHAHIVQCNDKCRLEYLCFLLNSMELSGYITGSAQPKLSQVNMNSISLILPSVETQDLILSVILPIEQKIALNTAINENLTEQARSIFQSWFIDYEPFCSSVPSDWKPATLSQIAVMKTDSWSPAKNPDVVVEHYSIPSYDAQRYPVFEIASGIKSNKYLLTSDSVMISKLNPDTKRIWRPLCLSGHPVCSTEFIVYEAKKRGQRDYIYSLIESVPFFNHLCSHTTGSTNSRQRATPKSTLDFALYLPPDSVIEDFCQIVTPIYDLIASNIVENQSLAQARDNLLPRLMSGDIDVYSLDL